MKFLLGICRIHNHTTSKLSSLSDDNIILNDYLMEYIMPYLFDEINRLEETNITTVSQSGENHSECINTILECYTTLLGFRIRIFHANNLPMSLNCWNNSIDMVKMESSSLVFNDHDQMSLVREHEELQSRLVDLTVHLIYDVLIRSEQCSYTPQCISHDEQFEEAKFIWQILAYLVLLSSSKWLEPPMVIQNASNKFLVKLLSFNNESYSISFYSVSNDEINNENTGGVQIKDIQELCSLVLPPIIVLIEMIPNRMTSLNNDHDSKARSNNNDDNDVMNHLLNIMEDAFSRSQLTIKSYGFSHFYECLTHFTQYTFNEKLLRSPSEITLSEKSSSVSSENLLINKSSSSDGDSHYFELMTNLTDCPTIRLGCLDLLRCLLIKQRFQLTPFLTNHEYPLATLNVESLGILIRIMLKDLRGSQNNNWNSNTNENNYDNDVEVSKQQRSDNPLYHPNYSYPYPTSQMFRLLIDWIQASNALTPVVFTTWPKMVFHNQMYCARNPQHSLKLHNDKNLCSHVYSFSFAYDENFDDKHTKVSYDNILNLIWPSSSVHIKTESQQRLTSSGIATNSGNNSGNTINSGFALSTWLCLHGQLHDQKPRPEFSQLSETDLFHHVKSNHLQHFISLDIKFQYSEQIDEFMYQLRTEPTDSLPSFSESSQSCSSDSRLSLQVWISSMYSCIYMRIAQFLPESKMIAENDQTMLHNKKRIILLGDLCIDFPMKKTIYEEWNHLFLFIQWIDSFNAKVQVIVNGWFESSGSLILNKNLLAGKLCHQCYPVIYFGHVTDIYSKGCRKHNLDLGNLFLLAGVPHMDQQVSRSNEKCPKRKSLKHNRDHLDLGGSYCNVKKIAMSFALLGPCWTGYFDSIEYGSHYRNYSLCILHSLVRRYAIKYSTLNEVGHLLSQLLLKTNSLISSADWLCFFKKYCSKNLFIILLSNNASSLQFLMPPPPSALSSSSNSFKCTVSSPTVTANDNGQDDDDDDGFQICDIYDIHSRNTDCHNNNSTKPVADKYTRTSRKRLWTLRDQYTHADNLKLTGELTSSVDFYYNPQFDSSFELHGGIEVPIYLLGELVCQSHDCLLIANGLELLFTMLHRSCTMFANFHTPALSHPGVEIPIEKHSNKPVTYPLSFGHCLLARLFKHPQFCSSSPHSSMLMEVLFNEIIFTFPNKSLRLNSTDQRSTSTQQYLHLIMDPGLLRCISLFSSRNFWYPLPQQEFEFISDHRKLFSSSIPLIKSSIFKYGLIPAIFEVLVNSEGMHSSNSIIITLYNFYTIDRWQLIMTSLTGFRETFLEDNHFMEKSVISQERFKQYTQNWPIHSLVSFITNRLSLSVIFSNGTIRGEDGGGTSKTAAAAFSADSSNKKYSEYIYSFGHSKRSCLQDLCRLIINLDADMYLSAAERVFYTIYDDFENENNKSTHTPHGQLKNRKQLNTKSSVSTSPLRLLNDDWIFWRQTTGKCLNYSERLNIWKYSLSIEKTKRFMKT
ncbi:unnamed protein product [Heterobilharzia americana]|nr:unnamed protein product [Heterobilharzia americana]